jgi:hypothetical protein
VVGTLLSTSFNNDVPQETVRELARADAFGPDLAASLNNLSADLAGLVRREDALAAARKPPACTWSWPGPAPARSAPTWPPP